MDSNHDYLVQSEAGYRLPHPGRGARRHERVMNAGENDSAGMAAATIGSGEQRIE
jgi:hypothetical protein